jgi:hypothetical protein
MPWHMPAFLLAVMRNHAVFQNGLRMARPVEAIQPCWPILFHDMRSALVLMQMAYSNRDGTSEEDNPKNTVHGG